MSLPPKYLDPGSLHVYTQTYIEDTIRDAVKRLTKYAFIEAKQYSDVAFMADTLYRAAIELGIPPNGLPEYVVPTQKESTVWQS